MPLSASLATSPTVSDRFRTALRERLVKIGARIGRHGRCLVFQLAEVVRRALSYQPWEVLTGTARRS